jgi:hypothetical protein
MRIMSLIEREVYNASGLRSQNTKWWQGMKEAL